METIKLVHGPVYRIEPPPARAVGWLRKTLLMLSWRAREAYWRKVLSDEYDRERCLADIRWLNSYKWDSNTPLVAEITAFRITKFHEHKQQLVELLVGGQELRLVSYSGMKPGQYGWCDVECVDYDNSNCQKITVKEADLEWQIDHLAE